MILLSSGIIGHAAECDMVIKKRKKHKEASGSELLLDLFSHYNSALRLYIRNIVKCEQTADEIAQETYVRLAAVQSDEKIDYPKAYLFRTARNISLDYLRRQGLRVVDDNVEVHEDVISSSTPNPEDHMMHAQMQKRLEKALLELPVKVRQVFYYRRYEDLKVAEVAMRMGISERLVYKNMEDAMQHLALRLKGQS